LHLTETPQDHGKDAWCYGNVSSILLISCLQTDLLQLQPPQVRRTRRRRTRRTTSRPIWFPNRAGRMTIGFHLLQQNARQVLQLPKWSSEVLPKGRTRKSCVIWAENESTINYPFASLLMLTEHRQCWSCTSKLQNIVPVFPKKT
jgi:hypothetical protein